MHRFYLLGNVGSEASVKCDSFQQAFLKFKEKFQGAWKIERDDNLIVNVNLSAPYQKHFKLENDIIETWVKGG